MSCSLKRYDELLLAEAEQWKKDPIWKDFATVIRLPVECEQIPPNQQTSREMIFLSCENRVFWLFHLYTYILTISYLIAHTENKPKQTETTTHL